MTVFHPRMVRNEELSSVADRVTHKQTNANNTVPHKRAPHTSERRTFYRPRTKNQHTATVNSNIPLFILAHM